MITNCNHDLVWCFLYILLTPQYSWFDDKRKVKLTCDDRQKINAWVGVKGYNIHGLGISCICEYWFERDSGTKTVSSDLNEKNSSLGEWKCIILFIVLGKKSTFS